MKTEFLKTLKTFCKSHKISGMKIVDMYRMFSEGKGNSSVTINQFELGLYALNNRTMRVLESKVSKYINDNGPDCYDKFIKEEQHLTKEMWDTFVGKIGYGTVQMNLFAGSTSEEDAEEKVVMPKKDEGVYEKLLPVKWGKMTVTEKIDFTGKVQHQGFFKYLLDSNPRIKDFFSKVKKSDKPTLKMYVSVFSFPSDNYTEEAKNLLKCFVEVLNQVGRANLQYIECSNPNTIEIREVR